ncbi:MAG: protein kinase [Phycisphaera sp.]|nr:protein kinase [Phycisphaera sp.]
MDTSEDIQGDESDGGIEHRITKDKGHVISGFTVLGALGHGAGSTIYAVEDAKGHIFALKHVERRGSADDRFVRQAITEYEEASRFDHPILRRAHKLIRERNLMRLKEVVVVLELVNGETLELLRTDDVAKTLEIMRHVARGLETMHEAGRVHADIKPNNILITRDNRVKVIDFGQACEIGTIKESVQGTPDFMAPEQMSRAAITPQTDIFNFGATLYWALTGEHIPTVFPKEGQGSGAMRIATRPKPPNEINADVPESLSQLVLDCVAFDPKNRPQSMRQVIFRIDNIEAEIKNGAVLDGEAPPIDQLELRADEVAAESSDAFGAGASDNFEDTDAALGVALDEAPEELSLGSLAPGRVSGTDEVHVLLVEDDESFASLVDSSLDEEDHDLHSPFVVHNVRSLGAAIEAVKNGQYNAILLDLSLPDSRGVDTLIDMHTHARTTPIIVLSGIENQYAMLDALKKGAQEFVNKDEMNPLMLSRTILHAIQRHRIQMRLIELAAERAEQGERRRRKMKDLQASRLRYKNIVQSMPDGLVIVNQKGELMFANEAAQMLFAGQNLKFQARGQKIETDTGQISRVGIQLPNGKEIEAELHTIMIEWREEPAMLVCIRRIWKR